MIRRADTFRDENLKFNVNPASTSSLSVGLHGESRNEASEGSEGSQKLIGFSQSIIILGKISYLEKLN